MKRLFVRIAALLLALALLPAGLALADGGDVRGDLGERFAKETRVDSQGNEWVKRDKLTTILLLGIDHKPGANVNTMRGGGQSDFMMLLVIDKANETIYPIQIDRDTMTNITILGVLGNVVGKKREQICLAHSFGDGKQMSNDFAAQAVSELFGGIDIDFTFSMKMDGIAEFNDAFGGVTVTVNEDMTDLDPALQKGAQVHLNGQQAYYFVRARKVVGNGTNAARETRQKIYLSALKDVAISKIRSNKNFVGKLFDTISDFSVTDMKRGRMINIAWECRDYLVADIVQAEGVHFVDKWGYMEFLPDAESLEQIALQIFYTPVAADTAAQQGDSQ